MNQLDFNNKEQTVYAISILNSPQFREGRSETKEGRKLYNKELRMAKQKIKKYNIQLSKPLPERM